MNKGGHKLSEAHKKRLSISAKIRASTPEWRKGQSDRARIQGLTNNPFKGKHHTNETKLKMALVKSGKPNLKIRGEKHYNWKGGVTSENHKIRISFEYKVWRETVFVRDSFLCLMPDCDKSEHYIEAHHIEPVSKNRHLIFEVSNGITLCRKCHNKTKTVEKKYEELFFSIIKTLYD